MRALLISMIVSLVTTLIITPQAIRFLWCAGINGRDLHKKNRPRLPASGGICVASGIIAGILSYVGIQTFVYGAQTVSIYLLGVISTILIVTFVGLIDDINVKSKDVETRDGKNLKMGLPQWIKPLLTLPAAIPLMVLNAGETTMSVPFIGLINFGIFYPLLLIPIGVVGVSNMINMLGGFNGLEASLGIVYSLSLGIFALMVGAETAGVIFLVTSAALVAFLKYNWYPAKILPGDSLTYLLGSIVASGVIVGNIEKVGLIIMLPFIFQGILKFYSLFKMKKFASDLGELQKDGSIKSKYGKNIYSLTHIVMNFGRLSEKQIVSILICIEIIFSILIFLGL